MVLYWQRLLVSLKAGKAPGQSGVPPELPRIGGHECAALLSQVMMAATKEGIPRLWRGVLAPVPKKPRRPFSLTNSRGVLCALTPAKLYGKVLWEQSDGNPQEHRGSGPARSGSWRRNRRAIGDGTL